jgi:hypothetical protein
MPLSLPRSESAASIGRRRSPGRRETATGWVDGRFPGMRSMHQPFGPVSGAPEPALRSFALLTADRSLARLGQERF